MSSRPLACWKREEGREDGQNTWLMSALFPSLTLTGAANTGQPQASVLEGDLKRFRYMPTALPHQPRLETAPNLYSLPLAAEPFSAA